MELDAGFEDDWIDVVNVGEVAMLVTDDEVRLGDEEATTLWPSGG